MKKNKSTKNVSNKIGESTYKALRLLVKVSRLSQDIVKETGCGPLGDKAFHKEFCTVRMTTARRSGHTTAISKLATEDFDRVLLISPNQAMLDNLKKNVWNRLQEVQSKVDLPCGFRCSKLANVSESFGVTMGNKGSIIEFGDKCYLFFSEPIKEIPNALRGHRLDAVIVDNASFLTKSTEQMIYGSLSTGMACNKHRFFIFVH